MLTTFKPKSASAFSAISAEHTAHLGNLDGLLIVVRCETPPPRLDHEVQLEDCSGLLDVLEDRSDLRSIPERPTLDLCESAAQCEFCMCEGIQRAESLLLVV